MRPVTVRTADLKNIIINLGFVGENEHRQIRFDAKKDFDEYPNASASLTVVPPEGESYPAIIERDGDYVLWTITDSDVIGKGDGEIQLAFTEGEVVKRTCIGRTKTDRSLVPTGSIPSGIDDFITRAGTLLEQVEETFPAGGTTGQVLAKKSDTDYDTEWVDQGGGTEDYDELENRPQIGGVTLTGNKTLHDLGAASEGDVDAKYTKPAGGIPASDIADGVIPDPEDLIDDTAGEGDTDKVWSADKSHALLTEITNAEGNVSDIKSVLGLDGTVVDYGTDFPLEITAEIGSVANLTFDTAQSFFVTNKNLIGSANESFTNWKKVSLPFRLPAGTYTLSALVTTTDTDKTYSNFVLLDGSTGVATYYLERDVRKAKTFTTSVPFDSIVFYASDDQTHGQGDTATWSDILLEKNGSATSFEAPNGYAESVGDSNTITIENAKTFIYTDDFSDVTGYGVSGATPVIPPMQQAIQKHDGFFADNNFEGNQGDKYNAFQSPYALSDMVDEAYIASNGSLLTGSSYSVFMVSPLVPVQKSGMYGIKVSKESNNVGNLINSVNGFCFYGQDGTTAISRTAEDLTSLGNDIYTLNVPEGTAFVRFTIYKVADYTQDRTLAQFNQWILLPDANSSINDGFFVLSTPKETGYADKIIRSDKSYVKLCSTELHEKKILVFGDSIWGNDRTDGVADFLKKYCGATIYNCAIGGTWICGDRSDYSGGAAWRAFDGVNLINAKLTDTWTDQDTYKDSVTSYAPEVLTLLKTVDMTKIDILILSYGTNDFANNKTSASIKSAYETVISAILTAYPRIRILICTPAWRMFNGTDDGDTYENGNNETIRDVGDAIVEMAKANHVAVQNMFEELPWRALTKAYYLDSDEVHPNTEGNKVYAHVVHGKLRSMF